MSPLPIRPPTSDRLVFATQAVGDRAPIFRDPMYASMLLDTFRAVKMVHPYAMVGYCLLPDHFHIMVQPTFPETISTIIQSVKRNFTLDYKRRIGVAGRMDFWQKSFMDHILRDEIDRQRHLDYIHINPIRHGYASRPEDWEWSSFRAWKERGVYADGWAWHLDDAMNAIARRLAEE
jgi:putative transposase